MWLLTAREMQAVDRDTIAAGTPAADLMRRAGTAVAEEALRLLVDARGPVAVVCGKGNNGGDGLVAARVLSERGVAVHVHLVHPLDEMSSEARAAAALLASAGIALDVLAEPAAATLERSLDDSALCIDAVLGTGARGAPHGRAAAVIAAIERAGRPTLAIDIPSGVEGDTGQVPGVAVRAGVTVTFGAPKFGHAFFPGRARCGRLVVADIGFPAAVLERHAADRVWIEAASAARWLPSLSPWAHKYTRGAVVVVAGSRRYTGAAALASTAALRAGAGIVHLVVPAGIRVILQDKTTEVIVHAAEETAAGALAAGALRAVEPLLGRARALVVGPGLDAGRETLACLRELLQRATMPAVVDADALGALPADGTHPGPRIATPHAGELERWTGEHVPPAPQARIDHARAVAARRGVVLVAKGAPTLVVDPRGTVFVNGTGHAGLATAGTGDVLAGVAGGLLAQGPDAPAHAAAASVWLQGRAAELAAVRRARRSLLASDLLDFLPEAMAEIDPQ